MTCRFIDSLQCRMLLVPSRQPCKVQMINLAVSLQSATPDCATVCHNSHTFAVQILCSRSPTAATSLWNTILAGVNAVWWLIAAIIFGQAHQQANTYGIPNAGYRVGVVVVSWVAFAAEILVVAVALMRLRPISSCCAKDHKPGSGLHHQAPAGPSRPHVVEVAKLQVGVQVTRCCLWLIVTDSGWVRLINQCSVKLTMLPSACI